ncbi:MAG TPA: hypothetical protein VKW04_18940 [Planctomycetota bacterium]|nr:hypothetical protein [Planctomycetota bacterium]
MTALAALLSILTFTPDLTKEDVKRLVMAGISDDVIVTYIRSYGPVRLLSPQDLVDLREANASEKVLAAVLASDAGPSPGDVPLEPPVTYSYPWYYPEGYYYDYYSGPYAWWYIGPGRWQYPRYHHGYSRRYPYPPYFLHGYRGGVQPPYHHPVNPPPAMPQRPIRPHPSPVQPAPGPHSAPHGGHH